MSTNNYNAIRYVVRLFSTKQMRKQLTTCRIRKVVFQKEVTFEPLQEGQDLAKLSKENEQWALRTKKGRMEKHRNVKERSG